MQTPEYVVRDSITRLVLWRGSRLDCSAFARAFGICYVEEV